MAIAFSLSGTTPNRKRCTCVVRRQSTGGIDGGIWLFDGGGAGDEGRGATARAGVQLRHVTGR